MRASSDRTPVINQSAQYSGSLPSNASCRPCSMPRIHLLQSGRADDSFDTLVG